MELALGDKFAYMFFSNQFLKLFDQKNLFSSVNRVTDWGKNISTATTD